MNDWVLLVVLLAAVGGVLYYWRWAAIKERVRNRLSESPSGSGSDQYVDRPFAHRYAWIPWLIGLAFGAVLVLVFSWPINIAVGISVSVALLALEADAWIYEWRIAKIESQLADTIDVIVASLCSGASLQDSLIEAAEYSPQPLQRQLSELVARLKLGDSPADVFQSLHKKVPTETFQLLSTSLTVNWETGGGLADTLAGVGKTIRDRIAISRQVRTLSTQGRLTTITVIAVIWFMAAMMWQAEPNRFVNFVNGIVGSWLITISLLLQGLGIALVSKLSRPKI